MRTPSSERHAGTGVRISVRARSWTLWHPWGVMAVEARVGRRRVGLARVAQACRRELGLESWWIIGLKVQAAHRRQGIGRRIVAVCLAAAAERGIPLLHAAVRAENAPSLALFEGSGFERVAERSLEEAVARVHKRLFRPPPQVLVLVKRLGAAVEAAPPKE